MALFATPLAAEIKDISRTISWTIDPSIVDYAGHTIKCGANAGGPYDDIDIVGGNPLYIPVDDMADPENPSYTITIIADTETFTNAFCVLSAYDSQGEDGNLSNEMSILSDTIETLVGVNSLQILNSNEVNGSIIELQRTINANYQFGEEVIIVEGQFKSGYKDFVIVGKESGKVWVIPNNASGPSGNYLPKQEWLSNVGLSNIDDIIPINFNRDSSLNSLGGHDDIAVIDYANGELKIFLNTGNSFNPTPVYDWHETKGYLGKFSGSYVFTVGASGDFSGNNCEDLMLYAPGTRNMIVWESDCSQIVERSSWGQGGGVYAYPYSIDYNGDGLDDIIFFNFLGGAFSAFPSDGSFFSFETVRTFSAGAFDYTIVGELIPFNGKGKEFGIHALNTNGNFVVFEYAPDYQNDPDPFKTRQIWFNTSNVLY